MNKIKLYIVGSVSTKGCFEYGDKGTYEDLYEVCGLQYQSSFISLMSKQLKLKSLDIFESLDGWSKKVITRDMNKIFLDELKDCKPNYIIIDLVSEVEGSVIQIEYTYISKIKGKTNKINLDDYDTKEISIKSHKDLYIELLTKNLNLFREFCKTNLPKTKLIFHVAPYLYSYLDGCRVPKSFENKGLISKNKQVKELYYMNCLDEDDLVIDMNDKTYFSTSKHKLSLNPLHYETKYYTDFVSELNRIVLKDFIKESAR